MVADPSFELDDDIYVMPCTPLICCSSGVVTVSATTCALAPGYCAATTTCGGVMSGNCEIGNRKKQMEPARTITIAIADAKIGRLMKNSTMTRPIDRSARC